uniref:Glycoside hydrolase family 31 N-terminal domain-containing protein n=1 Tax=Strigamia maritima TaxID=126957 RepID=T1IJ53_STRMM
MDTESETEEGNDLLNGKTKGGTKVKIQAPITDIRRRSESFPQVELSEYKWDKSDSTPTGSFKKKFVFTVPGVMKQKQPREYKLKAFVVFIFFLIIIYLSLTYVFHKQQELQILQTEIAEGIHFHDKTRTLRILNSNLQDVLKIQVGQYLPPDLIPYECFLEDIVYTKCFRWKNAGQLTIRRHPDSSNITVSRCYDISWDGLSQNTPLCDCFSINDAKWFGFGNVYGNPWPLNGRTNFSFIPFVTGSDDSSLGSILNRYLLSSKGISISIDSSVPLFVSLHQNGICLKSERAWPYSTVSNSSLRMSYSICSGSDVKSVHEFTVNELRPKAETVSDLKYFMKQVIWTPNIDMNTESLMTYLDAVMELGISNNLLVIDKWQQEEGDLTFDPIKFPNFNDTLDAIRLKKFDVILKAHPYISTSSKNYLKHIRFWIRDENNVVPALTRWNNISSAAILDFTNPEACDWFINKLKSLPVPHFVFQGGQSFFLPRRYTLFDPVFNPDILSQIYASKIAEISVGMNTASVKQLDLNYVSVSPRTPTWDRERGLNSILPLVFTLGIIGFPFINPGTVGGDGISDPELYTRWLQLSIFLPVLQLSHSPKTLSDECFQETKKLLEIRSRLVIPLLEQLVEDGVKGVPLIRPLWWVAPNDSVALEVDSEFLVGDDLLVAPVLESGSQFRDIYIPQGIWNNSGRLVAGPKWLLHHAVSLNQVPYFSRVIL